MYDRWNALVSIVISRGSRSQAAVGVQDSLGIHWIWASGSILSCNIWLFACRRGAAYLVSCSPHQRIGEGSLKPANWVGI